MADFLLWLTIVAKRDGAKRAHVLPYSCSMKKSTDILLLIEICIIYAMSVDILHAKSQEEAFMLLCPYSGCVPIVIELKINIVW